MLQWYYQITSGKSCNTKGTTIMKRILAPTICLVVALCVIQGTIISDNASQRKEVRADASINIYESRIMEIVDNVYSSKYIAKEEIIDIVDEAIPQVTSNDLAFQPYNIPLIPDIQLYVNEQCEKHGWGVNFIYSIMAVESKFDPNSVNINENGSVDGGLMQANSWLVRAYKKSTGLTANPQNPYDNIDMGIWLLNYLRDKFADNMSEEQFFSFVLVAYNAGEDDAIALGSDCINFKYVQKVLFYKNQLDQYQEVKEWL